ncbi:hypothetical protein [Ammoniphilus sp. YIM 78166]|uniref:hypothetical protein n=1 Tax=Ammoniphilus sp. YIM 78166 TaxID=1644106 RepID=UPI00107018E5|nr:hypothetical protein [Ammoniphilus sp. YIM 78166]
MDFSKLLTLYINATEKKVYRHTKNWSNVEIKDFYPKLNKEEIQVKLNQQYKDKAIQVGSLVITYSYYRKRPVLAYVVRVNQDYQFVNANTGKTEQMISDANRQLYWILQQTF